MSGADDSDRIVELFAAFGPVTVRRMFGGAGIFAGGRMLGLVDEGVIYLKAGETTIPAFEREGLGPFTYRTNDGTRSLTSYWRMPERLYDDPEELARWARGAQAVAARATRPRASTVRKRRAIAKPRRESSRAGVRHTFPRKT